MCVNKPSFNVIHTYINKILYVPFLCTISFSSWSYHEPYLLKYFSTHFVLCLMYKNYTHGKKDTTRCKEGRQLAVVWASPSWVLSTCLYSPCSYLHSPSSALSTLWLCLMNHPPPHLLRLLFRQPDTLASLPSLQAQVHFFFESKSDRMSSCLPWFPLPRWVLCFCGAGALISVWGGILPILL